MATTANSVLNVLLVYPRFEYPMSNGVAEPLGLLYIASHLREEGHNVSFLDLTFQTDLGCIDSALEGVDFVGMSSSTALFGRTRRVVQYIKSKKPELPLMLGGPHATLEIKDTLDAGFDIGFMAEADISIREFSRRFPHGDWQSTAGIYYLRDGELIKNPPAARLKNLDDVPFPARDLVDYKTYFERGLDDVAMVSSRGCPAKCIFCWPTLDKMFENLRVRSARNVAIEMEQIVKNFGDQFPIMFKDDMMTRHGLKFFRELRQELKERKVKVDWWCNSRVDDISYELVRLMKKAGCQRINFGVESGSRKVLKFYKKDITPEQARRAFKLCHHVGIWPTSNVMMGAPLETRKDLAATVRLIRDIKPVGIPIYFCTAMPGKAIFDWALKNNKLRYRIDYEDYDTAMNREKVNVNMTMDHLTPDDLFEYKAQVVALREKYIRRKAIRVIFWRIMSGKYILRILNSPVAFLKGTKKFLSENHVGLWFLWEAIRHPRTRLANLLDNLIQELQKVEWRMKFDVQFHHPDG